MRPGANTLPRRSHDSRPTSPLPQREHSVEPRNRPRANSDHRRTSSEATPRITPIPPKSGANDSDGRKEKGSGSSPRSRNLLFMTSHSRAESAMSSSANPPPLQPLSQPSSGGSKPQISPAKSNVTRTTYDPKVVSREMQRLGTLGHIPTPLLAGSANASSATLPQPGAQIGSNTENPWGALHVHVLPLFNAEPLRIPIEDLNALVRRHIRSVVSSTPSKALASLAKDARELLASGMVTLDRKLMSVGDDKLLSRLVEVWGFFWDQVLPYVEGVLLPLQTDSMLVALYSSRGHRPSSPTRGASVSKASLLTGVGPIDVRTLALQQFTDKIVKPLSPRIIAVLKGKEDLFDENSAYQHPRFEQMLLVLHTHGNQPRTISFFQSLTLETHTALQLSEYEVREIIRALRAREPIAGETLPEHPDGWNRKHGVLSIGGHPAYEQQYFTAPTSFLFGGAPRDRRGRIVRKAHASWVPADAMLDDNKAQERELEFLESLKSPGFAEEGGNRESMGGWGLGAGVEETSKDEEDEEDDAMNWDQAQAVVEQMVGMNDPESRPQHR